MTSPRTPGAAATLVAVAPLASGRGTSSTASPSTQTTYDKGLRVCADALDEKLLLAGSWQMDTAPVDRLVTRLRTALSSGAAWARDLPSLESGARSV